MPFPLFCLIGRCLAEIKRERVPRIILITPLWRSQPWFPILTEIITDTPLLLPTIMDLLLDLEPSSINSSGTSPVGRLGQPSKVEAFQRTQLQFSVLLGEPTLRLSILVPGTNGRDGVNKFISIPYQHLW